MLDQSTQPTQWTVANVAYLSIIRLGGKYTVTSKLINFLSSYDQIT